MRRSSSIATIDSLITREIGSNNYQDVVDVAAELTAVVAVAGALDDVATILPHISNVDTVAGSIVNVNATGTSIANVNTVAGSIANVNTTAGSIVNVNTVSGSIASVNTLAPVAGDIDVLAPQAANIAVVSTNVANVITTATNMDDVQTVAADLAQIPFSDTEDLGLISDPVTTNPAGTVSYLKTVADNMVNVTATGSNIANVNTVAGSIINVNSVAGNATNINAIATTVVPNITELLEVNDNATLVVGLLDSFDDRYLGAKAVEPTLDNDGNALINGALYFDTVTSAMRVWNGSLWSDALTLTAGSVSTLTNKTIDSITNRVGADHIHYACRNVSGSTIPAGIVVTANGTQSGTDYIEISPLTNNQTEIALGITHTSVSNNSTGLVINTGLNTDTVDTSLWPVGTVLYVGSTGGFTAVKPTSGVYQACGVVLRSHASQGTMLVEFTEPKSTVAKQLADMLASGIPIDMGSIV